MNKVKYKNGRQKKNLLASCVHSTLTQLFPTMVKETRPVSPTPLSGFLGCFIIAVAIDNWQQPKYGTFG